MSDQIVCPLCRRKAKPIDATHAAMLYHRLRNHLRVISSWGCYTPARGKAPPGDHSAWPLHYWRGPGHFPLVVEFSGKPGRRPTFDEFCKVYGLLPVVMMELPQRLEGRRDE